MTPRPGMDENTWLGIEPISRDKRRHETLYVSSLYAIQPCLFVSLSKKEQKTSDVVNYSFAFW